MSAVFSRFFDSRGNINEAELVAKGNAWIWKGKATGCTAVFTENNKIQTAHHVRLDENGTGPFDGSGVDQAPIAASPEIFGTG